MSANGNRGRELRLEHWVRAHPDLVALLTVGAGLLVRLKTASGTFLNYDEALHFSLANQTSWRLVYQASSLASHPPLLIFLLHAWRSLGTSEFMLRLPSALLGTGFCWVSFQWLKNLLGCTTALIGVILLSFSPSLVSLSAEVRQYALLLFLAACALHFLERSLNRGKGVSAAMPLSLLSLYLAILSHYSGVLFAAALALYTVLRLATGRPSGGLIALWAAGQAGALGICAFLYSHYITRLGSSALHGWMSGTYLHNSYFDSHRYHLALFIIARSGSVFQYIFLQSIVGGLAFVVFLAGIILLYRTEDLPAMRAVRPYQLVTLFLLPFAINCIAALAGKYPYGGTRHCIFLAVFGMAGISFALAKLVRQRVTHGMAIAFLTIVVCSLFPSRRLPYIARADQDKAHMQQLLEFIRQNVRPSDLLFADNQSGMLLAHYLCRQQPVSIDQSVPGYGSFACGGYRVLETNMDAFSFSAQNFLPRWEELPTRYGLKDGDTVWVVQAGWLWQDTLARQLQDNFPRFRDLTPQSFGHNITMFKLTAGTRSASGGGKT
jgi:hypothetical protein